MEKPNGTLGHHFLSDKSFHRDPYRCGDLTKESGYRWFIFPLAQNFWLLRFLNYKKADWYCVAPFVVGQKLSKGCGDLMKENLYKWIIFAFSQNVLTFKILLLWITWTVRCGAICHLTKAFKGTQIDAVIWRKKVHTCDLFLLWHKMFWLLKFCYYRKAKWYVAAPFAIWKKL